MRVWSICALLVLSACGGEAPAEKSPAQDVSISEELPIMGPERVILAFGDSLFAGYNLEQDEGYPEKLEAVLRTRGINARVIDAGVSGDTTAAGLQRLAFVLDNVSGDIDLAMVELGGNDLLRGIAPDETRANLEGILAELQAREIPVLIMGMRAPPNGGPQFQQAFDGIYPALAEQYSAALVPFFMEPVYDQPMLMQDDRIHPTAQGIEAMVAAQVDAIAAALPDDEGE